MTRFGACPFCGAESVKLVTNRVPCGENGLGDTVYRHRAYVRCNKCNARGPIASGRIVYPPRRAEWECDPFEINGRAEELWNRYGRLWEVFK